MPNPLNTTGRGQPNRLLQCLDKVVFDTFFSSSFFSDTLLAMQMTEFPGLQRRLVNRLVNTMAGETELQPGVDRIVVWERHGWASYPTVRLGPRMWHLTWQSALPQRLCVL